MIGNKMEKNIKEDSEDPWTIINAYFSNKHLQQLVRHQIESYNHFISIQIPNTIDMFNSVHICSEHDYDKKSGKYTLEIFITFDNFNIYRPQIHENNGATKLMFPQEARLRNFTYASNMTVNMNIKYIIRTGDDLENIQTLYKVLPKIHIGKLPIMLRSNLCVLTHYKHIPYEINGECKMDPGGYFIINGSEKTCLGQERAAENILYAFDVSKNNTKWSHIVEIKSVPDWKCISPKQISMMMSIKSNTFGNGIWIQIPRLKAPIPIVALFRALGVITDKDICKKVVLDIDNPNNKIFIECLKASIVESEPYNNYESAIKFITSQVIYTPLNMDKELGIQKKREFALDVLNNDLFPHCYNKTQKIYFLGFMTLKLLKCSLKMIPVDDRDSYLNKRIDLTGILLNNLFRNYFNKLVKDMQKQVIREINNGSWRSSEDYGNIINLTNIYKIVKSTTIENGFKRALATGDFGIKQTNNNKVGVAQVLNRLTYISSLSHLRRCNTPIDKSGKLIPPRKLHNSTWGFLCPAETPEGQSVGVVKNISYLATITINSNSTPIQEYINNDILNLDCGENLNNFVKVFINGCWIGITKDPVNLYESLKEKKYKGIINIYTSIIFDYKNMEIRVCNDAGRLVRPVLKVKDNKTLITNDIINKLKSEELDWDDLLCGCKIDESILEYIDPAEQNTSMIAMNNKELLNKNTNFIYKYTHREIHPSTLFGILASCIPFPEHNQSPRLTYQCAMGKQAMGVYVTNFDNRMDKTAYVHVYGMRPLVDTRVMNLINLHSIPSGAQVIVAIATYTGYNQEDSVIINKSALDRGLFRSSYYRTYIEYIEEGEKFEIPDISIRKSGNNYNYLDNTGIIKNNTYITDHDIIIGKTSNNNGKQIDKSTTIHHNDFGVVDGIYSHSFSDQSKFCKVRIRMERTPEFADKFGSRHGLKGVVGMLLNQEDMPFTSNGIIPDIIINPHGIPSRMSTGHLLECLTGKSCSNLGSLYDASPFENTNELENITTMLETSDYECYGNEILNNGYTGEQISANIFIGVQYYQRMKHMVHDKVQSRDVGPKTILERQPAKGRVRGGGLRLGEMERDSLISHGVSKFLQESYTIRSDNYKCYICKMCGRIGIVNPEKNIYSCNFCNNNYSFDEVRIPYCTKLFLQEMESQFVCMRLATEKY